MRGHGSSFVFAMKRNGVWNTRKSRERPRFFPKSIQQNRRVRLRPTQGDISQHRNLKAACTHFVKNEPEDVYRPEDKQHEKRKAL